MASSSSSFGRILLLGCWFPILTAAMGVSVKALQITGKPQEYISLAKLVAGGRMVSSTTGGPVYVDYLQDLYGTIIETLESAEMRRHAMERVRALNPDLKVADVDVRVTQNKGSAIFNVAAIGTEPKFTRVFLDALLDEFRAFRDQIREQQRNKAVTALAEDVVKREASLSAMREKVKKLDLPAATLAKAKVQALSEALNELVKKQAMANAADAAAMNEQLERVSKTVHEAKTTLSELTAAETALQAAESAYKAMFDTVRRFTVSEEMSSDYVSIMERASAAIEDVQPWQLPIIVGAVLGGGVGLALLLVLAGILSSKTNNPPPLPMPVA